MGAYILTSSMKKTLDELAADVSDPSDFKMIPKLMELDSSLRCNICRELYEGPVSISCGHCFDSLCIRSSMNTKAECPTCRKTANESHIRPVIALEEAAVAWKSARPIVLQLMRDNAESAKRKRNASEVGTSDDEIQIVPGPSKRQKQGVVELVECPICGKQVKGNAINGHIDRGCRVPSRSVSPSNSPVKSKQKKEWSDVFKGKKTEKSLVEEEERLPKVSTHILKEKTIRELLNKHGLDTTGDKNKLTARYVHWSMLFNSNLDKAPENRQPLERLRKELKTWEELSKGKKVVVDDVKGYEKTHRDEFAKLTNLAKQSLSQGSQQDGLPTSSPVQEVIDVE